MPIIKQVETLFGVNAVYWVLTEIQDNLKDSVTCRAAGYTSLAAFENGSEPILVKSLCVTGDKYATIEDLTSLEKAVKDLSLI